MQPPSAGAANPPLMLMLDFVEPEQAVARVLDLVRRMGFDLGHCAIEPGGRGFRMTLALGDPTGDAARQATLVLRLSQMPALDRVSAERIVERPAADGAPRARPGVASELGSGSPRA